LPPAQVGCRSRGATLTIAGFAGRAILNQLVHFDM